MNRILQILRVLSLCVVATGWACTPAAPSGNIQGQILGADGRPAIGVDARLDGASASTRTDSGGQFALGGASSSASTLRLAGPGTNAGIGLPPIADGMVVRLAVRLSAQGSALLASAPRAMLRGNIASLGDTDLRIGATSIHTDDDTDIRVGPWLVALDPDMLGQVADVDGLLQPDGSVLARVIHCSFRKNQREVEFTGAIESILPPDQLVVAKRLVRTDKKTRIEIAGKRAKFSALGIGQIVEVEGLKQPDQSVLARSIEAARPAPPPPASPPVANAGPDQSVTSGALVKLDGSASKDPSGLPLSFTWSQTSAPAVPLSNPASVNPSFTAPAVLFGAPPASLVFSLVVKDANAASAPDSVTITVNAVVPPPIANAGPDQRVASGALVQLDGSASSDPAGLPLHFAWTQASGSPVTLSDPTAVRPTFAAPVIAPGQPAATFTFSLVVSDANASSAPSSVSITVDAQPVPPKAPIANAGPNQTVDSGALVTLDGSASFDPDGFPLSFAWSQIAGPLVGLIGADTAHPSFSAPTVLFGQPAGILVFALVVSDVHLSSSPSTVTITVNPVRPPPVANAGPPQTVASGAQVTLDGSASQSIAGLPLTFSWSQASGTAVAVSGANTANPTFTAPSIPFNQAAAALLFSLVVSDANASSVPSSVTITVRPAPPPPPVANAGPDQAVASAAFVTLDGSASTDPAGLALSFAWTQTAGPVVTLSSTTVSNPSFTAPSIPFGSSPAILTFSLVVSDANASSPPAQVNVTVSAELPPNPAPVANAGPDQAVASGAAVALDGSASADPDGETITFAWTQSSGPSVILAGPNTAHPTFTAPVVPAGSPAATLAFSLVVADPHASSAAASVSITVNPEAQNFPPPPGTPPPADPNPAPLALGGNGSHRFEVGAPQGLYLHDPTPGEPSVRGFVIVTLGSPASGTGFLPPADTVVTMNGVPLLRDPNLNGTFWRVDPAGPQPKIGSGGQMVLVASATDPNTGKPIQRSLVLPCPNDIAVSSTPAIGSSLAGAPSVAISSLSDITFNVGVPIVASVFPQATLFGYDRASRNIVASGGPHNIGPGPLSITVPVTPAAAGDAYLLDLRWPGIFILDGQTGGFCGLAKRWTYTK